VSHGSTPTPATGCTPTPSSSSARTGWLAPNATSTSRDSSKPLLLEARDNLQRMLVAVPLIDDERAAVDDGQAAPSQLLERLADVPTPAGPPPRQTGVPAAAGLLPIAAHPSLLSRLQTQSSLSCPVGSRCAQRPQQFHLSSASASSCADPTCSISREPRLNEYTICTAVAPDDVFTVSTYGDIRGAAGGGVETSGGPPGQVSGPGAFITGLAVR
jgi:hypothetical protein